jgi:hypothetical protein
MALTVAKVTGGAYTVGNKKKRTVTVTFDSSYPTGGEALTAATLGVSGRTLIEVIPHGVFRNTDATLGIVVSYDYTNSKLVAYWGNAGTASGLPEVTDTTDLSTYSGRLSVISN